MNLVLRALGFSNSASPPFLHPCPGLSFLLPSFLSPFSSFLFSPLFAPPFHSSSLSSSPISFPLLFPSCSLLSSFPSHCPEEGGGLLSVERLMAGGGSHADPGDTLQSGVPWASP